MRWQNSGIMDLVQNTSQSVANFAFNAFAFDAVPVTCKKTRKPGVLRHGTLWLAARAASRTFGPADLAFLCMGFLAT